MTILTEGQSPSDTQVAAAVESYLQKNPPAAGQGATPEQIASAVTAYLQKNPPSPGKDATAEQIAAAVSLYLKANPPASGQNATDTQVLAAVATYLKANPPAAGKDGIVPTYKLTPASGSTPAALALQSNVMRVHMDAVTDASGNWSVDYSAAKFKSVLQVTAVGWNNTDAAVDQVDARSKTFSLTAASGSVVKGVNMTTVLIGAGQPTVAKAGAGIKLTVTVEGTV